MNLNLPTSACDQARLESFLSGELSEAEEREFTLHLNLCESCRCSLAEQAAEPDAWREAEHLLKPSQFDPENGDEAAESRSSARQPLQIQNVLDALGPTDDPAMLGRLGGYEVSGVVGAGGMGVVLKAIDKSLDRTVAIKVMAPHLASSGAARKRFAREAKAAAAVLHPNVIAIHSVSNDESLSYLVMPYVRGTSLQRRLDREGPLPLREILRIGAQIAAGLAAAHAQGLVHRDIKPANILLEEGVERVTITDFGLARAVDDATITHSGMIAGTPQYMSPEQARGEAVDPRSDLFSLGSVLYAICTGRPPFRAETSYGVMRRISDDRPKTIRELNPDVPPWLCQIIARLMSKQAGDRYQSANEVAELLEACLAHVQQPTAAPLPASLATQSSGSRSFPTSRRWLGVTAMTAACALLGFFLWQATTPPDISGRWTSEGGGEVVIAEQDVGQYEGTFTNLIKAEPNPFLEQLDPRDRAVPAGKMELKWSRAERRFNGAWQQGDDLNGKLSLRLVGDEIRGALTSSKKSAKESGTPRLADFVWKRNYVKRLADVPPKPDAETGVAPDRHRRIEGIVTDADKDQSLVEISIGTDDGLQTRDTLIVFRNKTYLGKITVVRVGADKSVAWIKSRKDDIQRGDRVALEIRGPIEVGDPSTPKYDDDVAEADPAAAANDASALPKGLRFLAPHKQLHGLSLGMTEKEFQAIVESQKLNVRKTTTDGNTTYSIPTGDGHTVIVMFRKGSDKCTGIQRLRGEEAAPKSDANAVPGARVRVPLSAATHSREMLRENIGFDQLSIMGNGLTGTVNGQKVNNLIGVMAHHCRLESFEETEDRGKKYWQATLFVPQDWTSDGSNLELSQKRLDQLREKGVQFWLDHHRDQTPTGALDEGSLAASSIATQVASRIERLKDSFPHLAGFSAAEHLRKNTGNPELYSIGYQHGVLGRRPVPKGGPKRAAEYTYDPETGIQLDVHFFQGDSRGADARPPFRIGNLSVHVYVKGPAADPIRDEIVSILKEVAADVERERAEQQKECPASPPAPVAPPTDVPGTPSSDPFDAPRPTVPDPRPLDTDAKSDSRGFSETTEVVLAAGSMQFMLDFDSGKTMDMPATRGRPEEKLMDVLTDQMQPYHFPRELIGRGLEGMEVKASQWDASAAEVRRALEFERSWPLKQMDLGPEKHPTYFFQTRHGAQGVLQLLEIVDEPKGIRLRYKTLKVASASARSELGKIVIDLYGVDISKSAGDAKFIELIKSLKALPGVTVNTRVSRKGEPGVSAVVRDRYGISAKEAQESKKESTLQAAINEALRAGGITTIRWEVEANVPSSDQGVTAPDSERPVDPEASLQPQQGAKKLVAPKESAAPKLMRQFSLSHRVGAIACSADGALIAIAHSDVLFPLAADWKPVVEILDGKTGKTVASLSLATDEERELLTTTKDLPHFEVGPLVFSPDAAVLAVSTGLGQVKLFNARSGELIRSLDDEKARLADKATPEKLKPLPRAMGAVRSLALSPDGSMLAMAGNSFEDVAGHWDRIERGGLGRAATGPGRLKVWDAKTGELKHDLAGHSHAFGVAFSPDGPWLASAGRWSTSGSDGNGVLLWDLEKAEIRHREILINANGSTHAVAFSPTKKLAAIGSIIFDKENDTRSSEIRAAYPLSGVTEWQQTIPGAAMPKAFLPDGKSVVVLCDRKSIRFINAETGQSRHEIKADESNVWVDLALAPQAGILVIAAAAKEPRGSIEIWDVAGIGGNDGTK